MINSFYSEPYGAGYQQELTQVEEFIETVKTQMVPDYLFLNFYAPHGFGKTTLVDRIWRRYEATLPTSRVQVEEFCKGAEFALTDALHRIIQDLEFRLPRRATKDDLPDGYEQSPDVAWLAELIVGLVSSAKDMGQVTLLLLDDYDVMPLVTSRWLEATLLAPLAKTRGAIVILTSEDGLRFTERIDLRMRLETVELSRWDAETISRSYPDYREIAPEIYQASGGLPLLTDELIQELRGLKIATIADFQAQETNLMRKYYRDHVDAMLAVSFDRETRKIILILSLLRRFDIAVLRTILPQFSEQCQSYGTADYLDLIARLGNWVKWRMQGGYAVNPAYKMALQGYTRFENPSLYKQVNTKAKQIYRDQLKKTYREHSVLEMLYHHLVLLELGNMGNATAIQTQLGGMLKEYLNSESAAALPEEDLISLQNALMQDPDLKDYVPEDASNTIENMVQARIDATRVIPMQARKA